MNKNIRYIAQAAIIAAMYAALVAVLPWISYSQVQVRIAEALTVLPAFTSAAIPGLFIGCLIANIFSPNAWIDVVVGSLATLTAAVASRYMPKKWLVPLPPVLINAAAIGIMLSIMYELPLALTILYIAAGQTVACYFIGYPLLLVLERNKHKIFKTDI